MMQFVLSQLHHVPSLLPSLLFPLFLSDSAVPRADQVRNGLRLVAEWCSWHPSLGVSLTARAVTDLVGDEGARLWFRVTGRVLWTSWSAARERRRRG
ncbi:hypothetical protein [Streptomyces sp. NPDC002530]